MKIDFQKLGETLNELVVDDELTIRVGRYEGDYHIGNGEFKRITGEFFIKTGADTIFRVVSDDSSIVDDFDIIGSDAIVTPIDKELENTPIWYDQVDINNKSSLRAYFGKGETGNAMFECVQSIPPRFRKDALDVFDDKDDLDIWDLGTIDTAWDDFLVEIIEEMTDEERDIYGY